MNKTFFITFILSARVYYIMPNSEDLIANMKGKGREEPAAGGASSSVFLDVMKAQKGKWFTTADFTEALKALGEDGKYTSNKLYNLRKNKNVTFEKNGRAVSYKWVD